MKIKDSSNYRKPTSYHIKYYNPDWTGKLLPHQIINFIDELKGMSKWEKLSVVMGVTATIPLVLMTYFSIDKPQTPRETHFEPSGLPSDLSLDAISHGDESSVHSVRIPVERDKIIKEVKVVDNNVVIEEVVQRVQLEQSWEARIKTNAQLGTLHIDYGFNGKDAGQAILLTRECYQEGLLTVNPSGSWSIDSNGCNPEAQIGQRISTRENDRRLPAQNKEDFSRRLRG